MILLNNPMLNRTLATDSLVIHLVQTVQFLFFFVIPTDSDSLVTEVAGVSGVYLGAVHTHIIHQSSAVQR
jgi:hypothetical protein